MNAIKRNLLPILVLVAVFAISAPVSLAARRAPERQVNSQQLVKKIRNDAGGQDSEDEANPSPGTLETAIKRLADLTNELRKDVEKTPRHVISAVVIDRANDVIGLIQRLRKLTH